MDFLCGAAGRFYIGKTPNFYLLSNKMGAPSSDQCGPVAALLLRFVVVIIYYVFSEQGKKMISRLLYTLLPFLQFAPHIIQQFFVIDAIGD